MSTLHLLRLKCLCDCVGEHLCVVQTTRHTITLEVRAHGFGNVIVTGTAGLNVAHYVRHVVREVSAKHFRGVNVKCICVCGSVYQVVILCRQLRFVKSLLLGPP